MNTKNIVRKFSANTNSCFLFTVIAYFTILREPTGVGRAEGKPSKDTINV